MFPYLGAAVARGGKNQRTKVDVVYLPVTVVDIVAVRFTTPNFTSFSAGRAWLQKQNTRIL